MAKATRTGGFSGRATKAPYFFLIIFPGVSANSVSFVATSWKPCIWL